VVSASVEQRTSELAASNLNEESSVSAGQDKVSSMTEQLTTTLRAPNAPPVNSIASGSSPVSSTVSSSDSSSTAPPGYRRLLSHSIGLLSTDTIVNLGGDADNDRIRVHAGGSGNNDLVIESADSTATFTAVTILAADAPAGKVIIEAGDGNDTF